MIVLDASALLAFLFREPGASLVASHLPGSCMSAVNLSEVIGRFTRDGHDTGQVRTRLAALPIEIVAFRGQEAADTATLIPSTRAAGLSLGDRACLALAASRGLPALTTDQAWASLALPVQVLLVR